MTPVPRSSAQLQKKWEMLYGITRQEGTHSTPIEGFRFEIRSNIQSMFFISVCQFGPRFLKIQYKSCQHVQNYNSAISFQCTTQWAKIAKRRLTLDLKVSVVQYKPYLAQMSTMALQAH